MTRSEQLVQLAGRDIELDCADYQGLQRLMQGLYEQLLVRNSAQIESINQQIMVLVEFIRARAERRRKILSAFGLSPSVPGAMEKLLMHCPIPNRNTYLQRWSELEKLIQLTKSLNERNGKLLAMHNDILNQILGGNAAAQVYSPRYY
ncbi:flagellar protein FlgN [Cellvibrio sp. KY-GH-1]|uniref:flagellar export chaperone FlgN n=1 Tax=Cellvibrio sp. KY-GH-1 TaxID=2303332 RepID=UPI00124667DE|nr:flagellar export chaperone FlgN [Cellvibrio sp. KY-GH-1]QEY16382.1 flagellar protein FlgN [Cellvibrio sp. KY-GH-1]